LVALKSFRCILCNNVINRNAIEIESAGILEVVPVEDHPAAHWDAG
jgi:hypothetical protein